VCGWPRAALHELRIGSEKCYGGKDSGSLSTCHCNTNSICPNEVDSMCLVWHNVAFGEER
jgi:hypothetical protein